jgi:hypothetical protein
MSMDPSKVRDEAEPLRSLDHEEDLDEAGHEAAWSSEIAKRIRQVAVHRVIAISLTADIA